MRKKKSSSSQMEPTSHRSNSSELFICFTSRPSASSAAGAGAGGAPSLSASLSRRLRTSGSVKGAQSPMFNNAASGRRSKGLGFETAEPTSPKVTCIGQVRVKGKQRRKKAKGAALRSRSKRVVGTAGNEASFRREEMGREREKNQGWVYQIPVSICDALKSVGSEFNCLLPCGSKSFCGSSNGDKGNGEEREFRVKRRGSCGAVLARWLMMQDNEDAKQEEQELERVEMERMVEMERRVEMERKVEMEREFEVELVKKEEILETEYEGEEKGRVSVCVPPKNALLLMRCRSDPVRMAALANRLWGSPVRKVHAEEEEVEEREEEEREAEEEREEEREADLCESVSEETERAMDLKESEALCECNNGGLDSEQGEEKEQEKNLGEPTKESFIVDSLNETEGEKACEISETQNPNPQAGSDPAQSEPTTQEPTTETLTLIPSKEEKQGSESETKPRRSTSCSPSHAKEERKAKTEEKKARQYRMRRQRSVTGGGSSSRERDSRRHSFSSEEPRRSSFSSVKDGRRSSFSIEGRRWSFSVEQDDIVVAKQSETEQEKTEDEKTEDEKTEEGKTEEMERKLERIVTERKKSGELPDCLLLMMYEPKLSMEVSRETWVRPTDFINWRAHKRHNPPNKQNPKTEEPETEEAKTEQSDDGQKDDTHKVTRVEETADREDPVHLVVKKCGDNEEKNRVRIELPAEVLYAPFVLKRCKSEPMRASARLVADACFWKERHRPIGAVGF